jgi:hypothetical protein
MKVKLAACNNPDRPGAGRRIAASFVPVESIKEASTVCQKFIEENELGGGNWSGGLVVDDNNTKIAQISYNGRAWQIGPYPQPEIKF